MHAREHPCDLTGEALWALARVKESLLSGNPSSLDGCAGWLESAVDCMAKLQGMVQELRSTELQHGPLHQQLGTEVGRLKVELEDISRLLHHAGGFYLGWGRLLLAAAADYTPQGEQALLPERRRLLGEF